MDLLLGGILILLSSPCTTGPLITLRRSHAIVENDKSRSRTAHVLIYVMDLINHFPFCWSPVCPCLSLVIRSALCYMIFQSVHSAGIVDGGQISEYDVLESSTRFYLSTKYSNSLSFGEHIRKYWIWSRSVCRVEGILCDYFVAYVCRRRC